MITIDPERCPQDHKCPAIRVCPADAITQVGNGLPVINHNKCICCKKCVSFCPKRAIN